MKTWVKLYTEINRDPDMASLTWAERGIWSALLALAGEIDARDDSGAETGELDTPERIAWHLRCDETEMEIALAAMRQRGMVTQRDGVVYIVHYGERQARPPSARPEAARERQARHRAEERHEDVTRMSRGVTPSEKKREDSEKKREDTDEERADAHSLVSPSALSVSHDSEDMEALIGDISADLKDGGHAKSNLTRVMNLWPEGMTEEAYLHWVKRAWDVTNKHHARGRIEGPPMPYFFGVLERGLKAVPT